LTPPQILTEGGTRFEPQVLVEHVRDELRQHASCPPDQWGTPFAIAKWLEIQADNLEEALTGMDAA